MDSGKAKQKNQTVAMDGQFRLACEEVDVEGSDVEIGSIDK
ncbi:MAG: hypothetical protein ACJAT4_000218 [Granulosicoccus sp.]|jgi:hypothetical protein